MCPQSLLTFYSFRDINENGGGSWCYWRKVNVLGYIDLAQMVAKSREYVLTPVTHGGMTTIEK